jgi:hypothetical protein
VDDHERDGFARAPVRPRRRLLEPARQPQQERERRERHEGQWRVQPEQDARHGYDRQRRQHEVVDAPVDEFADGVHVAGEPRDHPAGRVPLVEADRQALEVVVHPLPQVEQDRLPDPAGQGQEPTLRQVLRDGRDRERHADGEQDGRVVAGTGQGRYAPVDAELHQVWAGHPGRVLQQQQRNGDPQQPAVRAQQRAQQASAARPQQNRRTGLGGGALGVGVLRDPAPGVDVDGHATLTSSSADADRTAR